MRKKVWLAILLVSVLGLVAQAGSIIRTAVEPTGGPYTSVSSDNRIESQNVNTVYRAGTNSLKIRNANANRIIISVMRFDLSSVAGRNLAGSTFSHTITWETGSATNTYTVDVWGLNNGADDYWDSNTLTWNTAIGSLGWFTWSAGTYSNFSVAAKWQKLGTVTFTVTGGSPNLTVTTNPTDCNLDSFMAADTNGLVTLAIMEDVNTHWSDIASADISGTGLTFPESYRPTLTFPNTDGASNPQPANNATIVDLNLPQLTWTNLAGIGKCDVYFGTGDPNSSNYKTVLTKIGTIENPTTIQSISIPAGMRPLSEPTTYSWVVDGYKGTPLPSEPNFPGVIWKFQTTAIPVFTSQPAEQIKFETETAEFTVAVTSSSAVTYAWYRSPDNVNNTPGDDVAVGTNSPTLTLTGLTSTNEGYYYCKATNSGGSAYSNTANLAVKRKVAHWTLDGLVSELYADSSGEGHNADPNGTPSFVAGAGATTGNGVVIDLNNGYASAGTWNPSQHTGQFTISLWAKWAGQTAPTSWQGLIAKENSFGAATMMWQLEADMNNNNLALKSGTSTLTSTPLPIDTWMHVSVVFNGTTATIYRNGVSSVSGAFTQGTKTDAPVLLGASSMDTATGLFYTTFNGILDDVQIYNYALTWNQVIDLYHTVSGLSICTNRPTYDYTGDCLVTVADFATFATQWLNCGLYPVCP